MNHASRSNRLRTGFTLIELLTVMAIISILIAILLPALSGARRSSRDTKCRANLREIVSVSLMYTRQYDDKFPFAGQCDFGGQNCLLWNGHQYLGWNGTRSVPGGIKWVRPLNKDLGLDPSPGNPKGTEIALCPSDIGAVGETGSTEKIFDVLGSSYVLNPILTQGQHSIWEYREGDIGETDILQPARKVLAADHVAFGLTYDVSWSGINPGWHDITRPAAVIGFVDGHVELVKGRCQVREWQWYPEASGPAFTENLQPKVNWTVYPGCE